MKPFLLIDKIVSILIVLLFGYFVSDINKKESKPLVHKTMLIIMKIVFPIPMICYIYFLVVNNQISAWDLIALLSTIIGTTIVGFSKNKLGVKHSWAGYSKQNISEIEKTGIYAIVRHPLYTGIYIACFGTFLFVIQRVVNNPIIFIIYIISISFVVTFLYISSKKESVALKERFGEEFAQYEREVPAFIPRLFLRKEEDYDIRAE